MNDATVLNPNFYPHLRDAMEPYSNLERVKDVFDFTGVSNPMGTYGLDQIAPARITVDANGQYQLEKRGKIVLTARN